MGERFKFPAVVGEGSTCSITAGAFVLTARVYRDDTADPPWEREDGHGPVSDWRPVDSKRPGERLLNRDRESARFYDFAEAVKVAKAEGWDGEPFGQGTPGERAVRAVEADFKRLADWCADGWEYVGVAVTVAKAGVDLVGRYDHAIWGIESDCGAYVAEVADDIAAEALRAARAKLAELQA